jgi:hypothetical protein
MTKHSRTELVPLETRPENQTPEILEDISLRQPKEEPMTELDIEMECPKCHDIMEVCSSFDKLMYSCESCSFILKCV